MKKLSVSIDLGRKGGPAVKKPPKHGFGTQLIERSLPDYSMVMLDCGLNPQASYANLIFLSPRCGRPSDGSVRCPLLAKADIA